MSTKKVLAAAAGALALGLSPTAALSHTNSIGYVGDGNGGLNFWYGNWHGTPFNEAEIKIIFPDGTFSIDAFNLLEQNSPAGLLSGVNFFTSDGTQLVAYDPTGATNNGVMQESYVWQGINYTNLAPGTYTFVYIPLGDAESSNPTGTPTMDWMPMDQVIRTLTVTITQNDLNGDANNNGILDINEVTSGQAAAAFSAPTLVSSALSYNVSLSVASPTYVTNTVITHTSSEGDGKQTLNFDAATTVTATTVTTTTTTPVTTDTYSDGSTVSTNGTPVVTTSSSSQSAVSHTYSNFSGRIDQYQILDKVGRTLRGSLNHTPSQTKQKVRVFSKNYLGWAHGDYGYYGTSTILGTGVEIDVKPTWTIGGQYNNIGIDLTGVDSNSSLSKEHFGVFSMLRGNTLSLRTNGGFALNKYSVSRNVAGVFNNDSTANGQEWWVNNRLYLTRSKTIQPFIGHTVSNVRRDAFSENGSVQSARNVDEYNKTENVGEVGVNISHRFGGKKNDKFGVALEASVDTNTDAEFIASVDYNQTIYLEGLHQIADGINNSQVAAKVKFRF